MIKICDIISITNKFMQIIKEVAEKFVSWIKIKIRTHFADAAFDIYERQIWWASIGQNIGVEQNGKNASFERPVLIFRRFNNDQFWALPISTKVKTNKYCYTFSQNGKQFCVNLSQMRVMDRKRLLRYIGDLTPGDFFKVKAQIRKIIG